MTTTLRMVLSAFENARESRSLAEMARELNIPPATLESMIAYWVRKGRLRELGGTPPACGACHTQGCPLMTALPRRYELATGEIPPTELRPPCRPCD